LKESISHCQSVGFIAGNTGPRHFCDFGAVYKYPDLLAYLKRRQAVNE